MAEVIPVDVAVVGGGPAGCAVAISLARSGHRVALLERTGYGAARVGETLHPSVQPLLRELGVWERFLADGHTAAPGLAVQWGGAEPFETDHIFNPYGCGWNLDRLRFDRSLYEAASELEGVFAFSEVSRLVCERRPNHSGGARLLTFSAGSDNSHKADESGRRQLLLSARFVVVAVGRAAPPFRTLGSGRMAVDNLVGVVGLLPPARSTSPRAAGAERDPRIWIESVEDGWWYSVPLPCGSLIAVHLTDADLVRDRGGARAAWQHAFAQTSRLASRPQASVITKEVGLHPPDLRVVAANSYCRRDLVGRDYMFVGDAACAWDPLSGQGVFRALSEGRMAARAINDYIRRRDYDALTEYEEQMRKNFVAYLQQRGEMYRRETRWPSSPFWRRRHNATGSETLGFVPDRHIVAHQ